MKKTFSLILSLLLLQTLSAQEKIPQQRTVVFKWAPTGLIAGNVSLLGEYRFSTAKSLTAKIGVPATIKRTFQYQDRDTEFDVRSFSFLAGYRMYFSKKQLQGFYFEPYFKYVHLSGEGTGHGTIGNKPVVFNFSNDYNGIGIGGQLGVQFLIGHRFVIDLFLLGPEINSADNNFKAVEMSATVPWNSTEAAEAEQDIRNFIDDIPVIRKKLNIMVDKNNRTVASEYKGALPGIRAGISFGIAF